MICRDSIPGPSAWLAKRLLRAIGLGLASTSAIACGANVVFGEGDGEGGSGAFAGTGASGGGVDHGGSSEGGHSTSWWGGGFGEGGSGTFECDTPLLEHQSLVYQCFYKDNGTCPDRNSQVTFSQLGDYLNGENCDEFCCDSQRVEAVPCGPDPYVTDECCYYAIVGYSSECMGRPLVVDGAARTASACSRADWSDPVIEPAALDEATRRFLAERYTQAALLEHASIASFARFALDLLELGAPRDLVEGAQRAMGDEIGHAASCFALARRYGGRAVGPSRLDTSGASQRTHADVLAETVRDGCFGETLAALLAAEARDAATDPEVKRVMATIAEEEARHAELAWATIAWALAQDRSDYRRAISAAFMAGPPAAPADGIPSAVNAASARAHGQLDAAETSAVYARAAEAVLGPCARAVLAARSPAPATSSRRV